jgi:hypothetical protein
MIHQIEVEGVQYNCADAPATKQKELLHMLAARMTLHVGKDPDINLDANFLFGVLMSISESDFDKVAGIVLWKCVANGTDQLVDIGDFQGRVVSYYQLVAQAVGKNLADFIGWLNDARQVQPEPKAESTQAV